MPVPEVYLETALTKLKERDFRDQFFQWLELGDGSPKLEINIEGKSTSVPFFDLYCQPHLNYYLYLEHKVLACLAWHRILNGTLMYRAIQVERSPYPDRQRQKNHSILEKMVHRYSKTDPWILEAGIYQFSDGADGYINLTKPPLESYEGVTIDLEPELKVKGSGKAKEFPLEIGACMPDQFEFHLAQYKCIARFPYGWDLIFFFEQNLP